MTSDAVAAVAPDSIVDTLETVRCRTLALVEGLEWEALHRPLDPIMSPLVWDLPERGQANCTSW